MGPETGLLRAIAPYTIEEAYEVADAIAREDIAELKGELGDLLFQVVFHAQMAARKAGISISTMWRLVSRKRWCAAIHTYLVVLQQRAAGPQAGSWEAIKAGERSRIKRDKSAMAGVATALPALKRAQKLGERASSV